MVNIVGEWSKLTYMYMCSPKDICAYNVRWSALIVLETNDHCLKLMTIV